MNGQLLLHLVTLTEHVVAERTGELVLESCPHCQLPLSHREAWSWDHLANHRDTDRAYCLVCNTFPFKCQGLEAASNPSEYTDHRAVTLATPASKSLEELSREVDTGALDPSDLNLQACPGLIFLSLLGWQQYTKLTHFTGKMAGFKGVQQLKCFCLSWMPDRPEKDLEVVERLVSHMVTQYSYEEWEDTELSTEKRKLRDLSRELRLKVVREKEADIVVPSVLTPCVGSKKELATAADWKYHVLAHKYGEAFCVNYWGLGSKWREHKADRKVKAQVVEKAERHRGDTWLDVGGRMLEVFFEYDESVELVGPLTIANRMVKGNLPMMGASRNHEAAAYELKQAEDDYFFSMKVSGIH